MSSPAARRRARRRVLPGFPIEDKVFSADEVQDYFNGAKIVCLRCGKKYRTLGIHLKNIHEMEPDEYREIYGLPWTYGLSCAETTEIHGDIARGYHEDGTFETSAEQSILARKSLKDQKKRQPFKREQDKRALDIMNAGKTGEFTRLKRENTTKRGSPEHKEKMSKLPHVAGFGEMVRKYWTGREQTDEHVFKRTGFHKKSKTPKTQVINVTG